MPGRMFAGPSALKLVALLLATLLAVVLTLGCAEDETTTTLSAPPAGEPSSPTTASPEAGGSSTTAGSSTSVPPTVSSTVGTPPPGRGLTLAEVKNAGITLEFEEELLTFALANGSYERGEGGHGGSWLKVTLLDVSAFGDLNGDGLDDAALVLTIRHGATGNGPAASSDSDDPTASEYVVALLAQEGGPAEAGSHPLGAGARVDTLSIVDGEILLEARVPGPEDPGGGAQVPIAAVLQLPFYPSVDGRLLHVSQSSKTPSGDLREIVITAPQPGASVVGTCVIEGTVSIAPFENNLVYHVYDTAMTELGVGPVAVDAPDYGAPGTFEVVLDLNSLGCSGQVWVTVSDLSAADGSLLAMDAVDVINLAAT